MREIRHHENLQDERLWKYVGLVGQAMCSHGLRDAFESSRTDHAAVAREDGLICGVIVWQEITGRAFIGLAWVEPDFRRRGVYRALVEAVTQKARERGMGLIGAGIDPGNSLSMQVHNRLGFVMEIAYVGRAINATDGRG